MLQRLERADRFAELHPRLEVLDGRGETPARDTDRLDGKSNTQHVDRPR